MTDWLAIIHPALALTAPTAGETLFGLPLQTVGWIAAAAVVVLGLLYGLRDVRRFSLGRVGAVAGTAFAEGIRRKVLLITPLAMLGVILLVVLQEPVDERAGVQAAARYCLFASGLTAVITSIFLACTNLPREIESKVVFTIVTKPLSRLELVLGKVLGFTGIAGVVLAIMGVFSLVLLWVTSAVYTNQIETRLSGALPDESMRPYLRYLADEGLLTSRLPAEAAYLQSYAKLPPIAPDSDTQARWIYSSPMYMAIPFRITPEDLIPPDAPDAEPGSTGLQVVLRIPYQVRPETVTGYYLFAPDRAIPLNEIPRVRLRVTDINGNPIRLEGELTNSTHPLTVPTPPRTTEGVTFIRVDNETAARLVELGDFYIRVSGVDDTVIYGATPDAVQLAVPPMEGRAPRWILPFERDEPLPRRDILCYGAAGNFGMNLPGPEDDRPAPFAVFGYRDAPVPASDTVDFELRPGVERTGGIFDTSDVTAVTVSVANLTTGEVSPTITLYPENNRNSFFSVPTQYVQGGEFDIRLQTITRGHVLGLTSSRLLMVVDRQPFAWNVVKTLFVQWMLALLVVSVSVFCSTFLSWPIAVVATVIVLGGRWVVAQLGGALGDNTLGRRVAGDLFGQSGAGGAAEVVETGIGALASTTRTIASVLPDLGGYAAIGRVESGLIVTGEQFLDAAIVTFAYAIPLVVVAYVILRNKEVAP